MSVAVSCSNLCHVLEHKIYGIGFRADAVPQDMWDLRTKGMESGICCEVPHGNPQYRVCVLVGWMTPCTGFDVTWRWVSWSVCPCKRALNGNMWYHLRRLSTPEYVRSLACTRARTVVWTLEGVATAPHASRILVEKLAIQYIIYST